MTVTSRHPAVASFVAALALAVTGCGSDADGDDGAASSAEAGPESSSEVAPAAADAAGLDELTELLGAYDAATLGDGDPLGVAQRFGFPYRLSLPAGSTLHDVEVGFSNQTGDGIGGPTDFFYFSVVAPDGTIPPIDAEADDNGPGAEHVADVFDGTLGELGFERADESYANGPREAGGPSSVTWYYRPADAERVSFDGDAATTIDEVAVRGVEDLTRAFNDDRPDDMVAGYTINVSHPTDVPGTSEIPFLDDLIALVPLPSGARLDKGSLRTTVRDADSTQLGLGRVEFTMQLDWVTPELSGDDLVDFYSAATFDDPRLIAAKSVTGDSATWEPSEMTPLGDDHRLPVLLVSRHGGTLTTRPAEDDEPASIHLDISLSPVDVELSPANAEG